MKILFTMRILYFISIFFICCCMSLVVSYGNTYYFSNQGNNSNAGTSSQSPWKEVNKLDEIDLQPGDSVLFNRGDVFFGEIIMEVSGTLNAPIYFGNYGIGQKPLIKGSLDSAEVIQFSDSVYRFYSPSQVHNLYIDDTLFYPSRYPNTGFLRIARNDSKGVLKGKDLEHEDGYWDGATIVFRPKDWLYDWEVVDSFRNNTFYFDSTYQRNTAQRNFGYFLMNKKEEMDTEGEYYYDSNTDTCSFIPFESFSSENNLEAVVHDYGIYLADSVENIIVQGLQFKYYNRSGVYGLDHNKNVIVDGCDFQYLGEAGVRFRDRARNCVISNNTSMDNLGRGFSISNSSNCSIVSNVIKRIGLHPGFGTQNVNGMSAIIVEAFDESSSRHHDLTVFKSDSNYVGYNTIDSCGYIGIRLEGDYNLAEKNIVRYPVLKLSDGSGIYFWKHTHYTTVKNNFVFNAEGNNESTSANYPAIASGIYFDGESSNCTGMNNTVVNCGGGMSLNAKTFEHKAIGNLFYGNYRQLVTPTPNYQLDKNYLIKHNILYCTSNDQYCYTHMLRTKNNDFGTLDSNYYFNPYKSYIINEIWSGRNTYDLAEWQEESGQDMQSREAFFGKENVEKFDPRLFHNFTDQDTTITLDSVYVNMDSIQVEHLTLKAYTSDLLFNVDTSFTSSEPPLVNIITNLENKQKINIYPNPTRNFLYVEYDAYIANIERITIFSNDGKIIQHFESINPGNKLKMNIKHLEKGIYHISIKTNKETVIKKLVIY